MKGQKTQSRAFRQSACVGPPCRPLSGFYTRSSATEPDVRSTSCLSKLKNMPATPVGSRYDGVHSHTDCHQYCRSMYRGEDHHPLTSVDDTPQRRHTARIARLTRREDHASNSARLRLSASDEHRTAPLRRCGFQASIATKVIVPDCRGPISNL